MRGLSVAVGHGDSNYKEPVRGGARFVTYVDHYAALSAPESREHFVRTLGEICKQAGADKFIAIHLAGHDHSHVANVFHNGGSDAAELLVSNRHPTVDALMSLLRARRVPQLLGTDDAPVLEIPGFERACAAIHFGDAVGCVLVFGWGSRRGGPEDIVLLMQDLQLAALYAMAGLATMPRRANPLREREVQCLAHFLASMGTKETARALGISVRTVEGHLDRARLGCGAETTIGAAMAALSEGWITMAQVREIERGPSRAAG